MLLEEESWVPYYRPSIRFRVYTNCKGFVSRVLSVFLFFQLRFGWVASGGGGGLRVGALRGLGGSGGCGGWGLAEGWRGLSGVGGVGGGGASPEVCF